MIRFLLEAGPFIWPIILLCLVIIFLALWNCLLLLVQPHISAAHRRQSINAILFWGGVAAVLGVLGQWMGIHRMTVAVAEKGIVNPQMVAYGISESLLTPVAGMAVLVVAAITWFFLRLGLWSVARRT
jgi:uncharacterized membrane protein YjfL (UPF0719 family)